MVYIRLDEKNRWDFRCCMPEYFYGQILEKEVLAVGAVDEGQKRVAGICIFREEGEGICLKWIFTEPAYRRKGVAEDMLFHMLTVFGEGNLTAGVFAEYAKEDAEGVEELFLKTGFELQAAEVPVYSVLVEKLHMMKRLDKVKKEEGTKFLFELSEKEKSLLETAFLDHQEMIPIAFPVDWAKYKQGISCVSIWKGKVCAALLFSGGDGMIEFSCAYSAPEGGTAFGKLIVLATKEMLKTYKEDERLIIPCVTEASQKLVGKLLPMLEKFQVQSARYMF